MKTEKPSFRSVFIGVHQRPMSSRFSRPLGSMNVKAPAVSAPVPYFGSRIPGGPPPPGDPGNPLDRGPKQPLREFTLPVYIGEAHIAALIEIRQPRVVHADQTEDRRIHVVDVVGRFG